ncbi:MAG: homoprotocatechuate degradation operon regulator HpaR [Sulfitobacter sp.]|nr:homoprotocatechuate degradation operon regulator HpaR [Sulfitobacter sp.]
MARTSRQRALPSTERSLPIGLIRARERVMAPIREMLQESGITEQQWRVLRVLDEFDALDSTEVARRAGLLLPSLTRIVRTLEDRGLLSKRQDERDGRRQILGITEAGAGVIRANSARAGEIAQGFRTALGPEQYETLLDLLEQLEGFEMP